MERVSVKIISGISSFGGSTVAHINLCNLLNENGIGAEFYGPHPWHLDKCRAKPLEEVEPEKGDIFITHLIRPIKLMEGFFKKTVMSCHETDKYPLQQMKKAGRLNLSDFDFIHFVSEFQRDWHGISKSNVVIPNVISPLTKSPCDTGAAGIIGSIDNHKQTHISLLRAKQDGYKKILLFGEITDHHYFNKQVRPIIDGGKEITHLGTSDDKQAMYDQLDIVYHSSKRESFNYIKGECGITGVEYRGVDTADPGSEYASSADILQKWVKALDLW